ncbi:hypothetical protein [Gordonia hydrophobica]|uniref:Interferon-induced transmembrane protein n=1 Tax=Gordonia hydrophobica TaxID=40516 RepID=A0ABZ2U3I4_9ACTN|nr:hypothetical protein [Gordonia hydrophobica]MBM7367870.1 hypothetical protein [Gordonia hydrophobica]
MTSPEDQNGADPTADETVVVPTPPAADDVDKTSTVSLTKGDDAGSTTPYYESEWSPAYAQTEIRSTSPFGAPDVVPEQPQSAFDPTAQQGFEAPAYGQPYGQQPYAEQGYGQPQYATPPAVPPPAYGYGTPYQPVGAPVYGSANGLPPHVSNTSAILAIVFGGLLVAGCYTTLIGIAPLVLGIVSMNKSNSVSKLWYVGQTQQAYDAIESSKNLAKWAWISMAIGFAVVIAVVLVIVAIAVGTSA